jgi:peptide/nickel transport system substrate-binding protein
MASQDDKQFQLTQQLMAHMERNGVNRRQFLRMLGVVGGGASLSGLLAACGASPSAPASNSGSTSSESPAAPEATTAPASNDAGSAAEPTAAPEAPAAGGASSKLIVFASGQDISNLDPHIGHDYSNASAQKSVYDTLFVYRNNPPEVHQLLAAEYSSNDDATVWTFKLAENAVFHDGTPVTASDVVYSAERMLRKNKGAAWLFTSIIEEGSVVASDDKTVVFNLTVPFAPLPLILPWLFIVNEKVVKEHEVDGDEGEKWLMENEAGSGPFTIKSWNVGDSYEFTAVEDYWAGWEEGHAPGYIWKIVRESSSARLGMLNGDYHMAFDLSAEDAVALDETEGFTLNRQQGLGVGAIKMNNASGPCSDINVRKAISYAYDYESVIAALNDLAVPLNGPLPNLGEFNNPNLNLYRFDMEKAKEALAQSQYPDGGFELEYIYVTGLVIQEQMGLILLDKLSELNISLKMTPLVWPDMVARAQSPETASDLMPVYSGTTYADPDNFLWQAYHSSQAGFWAAASHYKNPELDALLEEGRSTPDKAKRIEIYHKAQEILVNDCVEIWSHSEFLRVTWSNKVQGYNYCPIMGYYIRPLYLVD